MTDVTQTAAASDFDSADATVTGERPTPFSARAAWASYEFGGGPYFTALLVFVFASYFANGVVVGDPVKGFAYWGYVGAMAGLMVALFSPIVGAIADRYSKLRPVPFAEYIPYRSFFRLFSDKVDLVTRDFAPGDSIGLFRVPTAAGGTLAVGLNICFEVAVDDVVRDSVREGANLISIQTNNATFGFTDESVQQLAISRIRAIEHGRSVVHVSNVGVSALITPDGTPHQSTSLFTSAVLSGDLPLRSAPTLATRVGAWPEWIACGGLIVLLALALRRRSDQDSTTAPEQTAEQTLRAAEPQHPTQATAPSTVTEGA